MVTPYGNNGDLKSIIVKNIKSEKKLSLKESMFLLYQICLGLHELYVRDLAHLDLKPENIFIRNHILMIGDYGLSKTNKE